MKKWEPTMQMQMFVDGLLSGKNIADSMAYAKADRTNYYKSWRNNPDFQGYLERRRKEEAGAKLPKIDKTLFEKAESGDVGAMRLVYEIYGPLRTGQAVVINSNQPSVEEEPGKKVLSMLDALEKKAKLNVVKS